MNRPRLNTQSLRTGITAALALSSLFIFSSCSSHSPGGTITVAQTSGYQPNFGPFDSNGNYVDAWADKPPRRRYVNSDGKPSSPSRNSGSGYTPPAPVAHTPPPKASKPTASKPKPKPAPKPSSSARSHTVKRGDTLYGLSRKYGVSVSAIQRANKLRNTTIHVGQRLSIPR